MQQWSFSPSVIGKTHSLVFGDAAAWDLEFFPVRNRERVPKTTLSPSVIDNVCKNGFSPTGVAKNDPSGVDDERGKNLRLRRPSFAAVFFASRWSAFCAGRCRINFSTEAGKRELELFPVRARRKYVKGASPHAEVEELRWSQCWVLHQ